MLLRYWMFYEGHLFNHKIKGQSILNFELIFSHATLDNSSFPFKFSLRLYREKEKYYFSMSYCFKQFITLYNTFRQNKHWFQHVIIKEVVIILFYRNRKIHKHTLNNFFKNKEYLNNFIKIFVLYLFQSRGRGNLQLLGNWQKCLENDHNYSVLLWFWVVFYL